MLLSEDVCPDNEGNGEKVYERKKRLDPEMRGHQSTRRIMTSLLLFLPSSNIVTHFPAGETTFKIRSVLVRLVIDVRFRDSLSS